LTPIVAIILAAGPFDTAVANQAVICKTSAYKLLAVPDVMRTVVRKMRICIVCTTIIRVFVVDLCLFENSKTFFFCYI